MQPDYLSLLNQWRRPQTGGLLPYDPRGDVLPAVRAALMEQEQSGIPMQRPLLGEPAGRGRPWGLLGDRGPTAEGRLRGGNMPGDFGKWGSGLLRGMGWAFAPSMMAMARRDRDRLSDKEQRGPGGGFGGSYGAGDRTSRGGGGLLGHI